MTPPPFTIPGEFWLAWDHKTYPRWAHNVWVGLDGQLWGGVEWWMFALAAQAGLLRDVGQGSQQLRLWAA